MHIIRKEKLKVVIRKYGDYNPNRLKAKKKYIEQ